MGERVRVVRHGERLVAVKEAGVDGGDALRAEAETLHRVQGPGVVELVGLRDGEAPALLTAWVGARSLAEVGSPLPPRQAAALCLAIATTLGRLHRAGVVHAAVEPAHVLLDAHGRPVLCGFGGSGPIGAPVRRPATDRSEPHGGVGAAPPTLRPALDVGGVGDLLAHLLGDRPPSGLGRATRRAAREWRALRGVADHARLDDVGARPSLAAFSRGVRRAAPDARLGDSGEATRRATTSAGDDRGTAPTGDHPDRVRHRPSPRAGTQAPTRLPRGAPAVVALLALLAVAATSYFGLSAWWTSSPGSPSSAADRREGSSPPSTSPSASVASPVTTDTTITTTTTSPGSDPDGSGHGAAVVVEHDGRRYAVGRAGDVVLVGPWRCDGRSLAAVLRTDDGSVHLFDSWAEPDGELTARQVGLVPGATDLEAVADGPGCAALVVGRDTETLTTLTAEDLL